MVKVFKGIDLTVVSPRNESELNLAKVSGRLEQIDSNEFMFTDVPKKIYAPKDRFYDGDYVSCVIGDDGKTARVYFKKLDIADADKFLEAAYQELNLVCQRLKDYQNGNMEE